MEANDPNIIESEGTNRLIYEYIHDVFLIDKTKISGIFRSKTGL